MIHTVHLFPELDEKLIALLKSLQPDDWDKPTVARLWTVRDVAAHLLDGNIRAISGRDGHRTVPDREINSYEDLVAYLNQFNADWVKASRRISPQLLTELLESTGKQYSQIMATQDLNADARYSVAWAGESVSKNWFHIAREYTEKWHHQQQIRDAVDKPGIMTKHLFQPLMDTFLRGLPHTYRNTPAQEGTAIAIHIGLEEPVTAYNVRREGRWVIEGTWDGPADAVITIPSDTAWKLFTKAITAADAAKKVTITGNDPLATVSLNLIAVMA
nr:maleylpyruvate isomerase N-terminal domain-containing protein [uncultured Dyadobacter sp.]